MRLPNRFLDDLAHVGTGLVALSGDLRAHIKHRLRCRAASIAKDLGLVTREEFMVLREMVQKVRLDAQAVSPEPESET